MFIIDDILLSPIKMTIWFAKKIKEHAEEELYNVEAIKLALEELQEQHDSGELSDVEFSRREGKLLKTLQEAIEHQKGKEGEAIETKDKEKKGAS